MIMSGRCFTSSYSSPTSTTNCNKEVSPDKTLFRAACRQDLPGQSPDRNSFRAARRQDLPGASPDRATFRAASRQQLPSQLSPSDHCYYSLSGSTEETLSLSEERSDFVPDARSEAVRLLEKVLECFNHSNDNDHHRPSRGSRGGRRYRRNSQASSGIWHHSANRQHGSNQLNHDSELFKESSVPRNSSSGSRYASRRGSSGSGCRSSNSSSSRCRSSSSLHTDAE